MLIPVNNIYAELDNTIEIYVSVNGSDSNIGDFENPLASLEGAKNKVRELNDGEKNIIVNFMDGDKL